MYVVFDMVRFHRLIGGLDVSALHGPGPWGIINLKVISFSCCILCFISAAWGWGSSRWWGGGPVLV